uniref:G-protein coupled receptors family 1 profile domain-containing protein n=1 Tax=Knipowitschia caucasica TaxID=637954 RepID=A0AAV2IY53_KNICA
MCRVRGVGCDTTSPASSSGDVQYPSLAMNATISFPLLASFSAHEHSLLFLTVLLYIVSVLLSAFLALLICWDSRLHRPMYVLLANLLLSTVSLVDCMVQVFVTNLYTGGVFCMLAVMALDRYMCVCVPLRYHVLMTPLNLKLLLCGVYSFLFTISVVQVFLVSRMTLCRFSMDKLLCDTLTVTKLACEPSSTVGSFGLFCSFSVVVLPCVMILLSYAHILVVVVKTSGRSQSKALRTCAPHLITFANFSMASFFGVINRRLNDNTPRPVYIVVVLVVLVFPPLLHPLVYGINMKEIRDRVKRIHTNATGSK